MKLDKGSWINVMLRNLVSKYEVICLGSEMVRFTLQKDRFGVP